MATKYWCLARTFPLERRSKPMRGQTIHYLCDEEDNWQPDLADIRSKITLTLGAS